MLRSVAQHRERQKGTREVELRKKRQWLPLASSFTPDRAFRGPQAVICPARAIQPETFPLRLISISAKAPTKKGNFR
jgi:hypothetical protein